MKKFLSLMVAAVLLFGLCACSVNIDTGSPKPTDTPAPTDMPVPTATPAPTATPKPAEPQPNLGIKAAALPTDIIEGESFNIRGIVQTDRGVLTDVHAGIKDQSGNKVLESQRYDPEEEHFDLSTTVNNDLSFGALSAGTYTLTVKATAKDKTQETTKEVVSQVFNVQARPSIWVTDETYPDELYEGDSFTLRGTVQTNEGVLTQVYATILDEDGDSVERSEIYTPNTSSFNIHHSIDDDLSFGILDSGSYSYVVTATAALGTASVSYDVIDQDFVIYPNNPQPPQPDPQPSDPFSSDYWDAFWNEFSAENEGYEVRSVKYIGEGWFDLTVSTDVVEIDDSMTVEFNYYNGEWDIIG